MKQRIAKYGLSSIVLLFLFMFGCQQDDFLRENDSIDQRAKINYKKISFSDLKSKKPVISKLKEFSDGIKKSGLNYRTVYDDDFGVFIDTTDIAFIERDGYHSITFRIFKEEPEDMNKIENLILTQEKNGSYTAYIAEYNLTEQQQSLLAEGFDIDVTQNVTISVFSRGEIRYGTYIINGQCFVYTFMVAPAGFGLVEYTVVGITPCSGSSDAGYEGGGGGGDPVPGDSGGGYEVPGSPVNTIPGIPTGHNGWGGGGSGSGSGNNTTPPAELTDAFGNPVLTAPLLKDPHIKELNKITNQNTIRDYINNFRKSVSSPLIEEGIEFNSNNSPFPAQNNVYNGVNFFPVSQNNPIIRAHKHHNGLHPVFSAEDILGMVDFFTEKQVFDSDNAGNITSIMVSKTGLHAFRVGDIASAAMFSQVYSTIDAKKGLKSVYIKKVINESIKECNCTSGTTFDNLLFDNFIDFMKEWGWGFDYYFAPHPISNPDTSNYIWTKQN